MKARAVAERMGEIALAMDKLSSKWEARHGGEAPMISAGDESPFEALSAQDARAEGESEEAVLMWLEAQAWLLEFLFAEGPHPGVVMRRLYAWVKKFRPQCVWDAGFRELGLLLGESHGAMEWRIGAMIDEYAAAKGLKGVKSPWQRGDEACAAYAEAQRGNDNRTGGKKSARRKARKG